MRAIPKDALAPLHPSLPLQRRCRRAHHLLPSPGDCNKPVCDVVSWLCGALHLPSIAHIEPDVRLAMAREPVPSSRVYPPLIYAIPVCLAVWLAIHGVVALKSHEVAMAGAYGLQRLPACRTVGVALPLLFTITVISTCTWALGEEIGWRGFLFPRLYNRFGFHGACLISGLIHAAWHYPVLCASDYNVGTNAIYAFVCFTVGVTAFGYIMGYLRMCTASLWPCVLFHGAHNSFVEGIFDPLTASVGYAKFITSEFGAGL